MKAEVQAAAIGAFGALLGAVTGSVASLYIYFSNQPVQYIVAVATSGVKNAGTGGIARIIFAEVNGGAVAVDLMSNFGESVMQQKMVNSIVTTGAQLDKIDFASVELLARGEKSGWSFEWIEIQNTSTGDTRCLRDTTNGFLEKTRTRVTSRETLAITDGYCN